MLERIQDFIKKNYKSNYQAVVIKYDKKEIYLIEYIDAKSNRYKVKKTFTFDQFDEWNRVMQKCIDTLFSDEKEDWGDDD